MAILSQLRAISFKAGLPAFRMWAPAGLSAKFHEFATPQQIHESPIIVQQYQFPNLQILHLSTNLDGDEEVFSFHTRFLPPVAEMCRYNIVCGAFRVYTKMPKSCLVSSVQLVHTYILQIQNTSISP